MPRRPNASVQRNTGCLDTVRALENRRNSPVDLRVVSETGFPSFTTSMKRDNMSRILLAMMFSIGVSGAAFAANDSREVAMKDGGSLIIYKDGKMAMRDSKGKTKSMKPGMVMETADGRKFTMRGNELWRRTSQEDLFKPQ